MYAGQYSVYIKSMSWIGFDVNLTSFNINCPLGCWKQ